MTVERAVSSGDGPTIDVTTWYLEQRDPGDLRWPVRQPHLAVEITRVDGPSPEINRRLYETVGVDWHWTDRLAWSPSQWRQWLDRPGVETWVAHHEARPAGYVELDPQATGQVEIAYFGLLPAFIGRGVGGHLLAVGAARAWDLAERWPGREPTRRVWVHTCSLDGPAALTNYRARGFTVYETLTQPERLPDRCSDGLDSSGGLDSSERSGRSDRERSGGVGGSSTAVPPRDLSI